MEIKLGKDVFILDRSHLAGHDFSPWRDTWIPLDAVGVSFSAVIGDNDASYFKLLEFMFANKPDGYRTKPEQMNYTHFHITEPPEFIEKASRGQE